MYVSLNFIARLVSVSSLRIVFIGLLCVYRTAFRRLVDRLVSLAKEHEELLQLLANERAQRNDETQKIADQFRSEIKLLEEKVKRTEEETIEAQSKRGMAMGCLAFTRKRWCS